MKKLTLPVISILSTLGIFNALVFCLCKNLTNNFWCGYVFITLSLLIVLLSYIISAFRKNPDVVSGLSIKTLSIYYFIYELVLGSSLMYFNISLTAVLLPQIISFFIFIPIYALAISKIGTEQTNDKTEQKNENK